MHSVARLSCCACEFEKRENRPGSKKGPGSTGNRAGGSSGGQHVAGQQTDERNREKGFFIEFVLACLSTGGDDE